MRTNIVIDDELMAEAQKLSGLKTKRETVETALQEMVDRLGRQEILNLAGKVKWEGDLNEMRQNFFRDFS